MAWRSSCGPSGARQCGVAPSKIPTSRAKNAREIGHRAPGIFISCGGPQAYGHSGQPAREPALNLPKGHLSPHYNVGKDSFITQRFYRIDLGGSTGREVTSQQSHEDEQ